MPKVAYSEEDRERIRAELVSVGLELMTKQGIRHTTVEQVYKRVGISRTFFYTFFSTKEELILETLYLQQPRVIDYAHKLMADPALSWHEAVKKFLHDCCYGEKNGIAVLTIEEQQLIFKRLSEENYQLFRQKQQWLFGKILESYKLFDIYEGSQVQEGYKSVAYSLSFRAKDRTLTDEEVGAAMKKILQGLSGLGIELRS